MMSREVAERCVQLMEASAGSIGTVDITGGAPELMPEFRWDWRWRWRLGPLIGWLVWLLAVCRPRACCPSRHEALRPCTRLGC